jgi:hypothetical protein
MRKKTMAKKGGDGNLVPVVYSPLRLASSFQLSVRYLQGKRLVAMPSGGSHALRLASVFRLATALIL